MEEIQEKKQDIREDIAAKMKALSTDEVVQKTKAIESRLFEFANYLEARIAMLYTPAACEVNTMNIIKRSYMYNKIIVLPSFNPQYNKITLMKVDDAERDLIQGPRGNAEPDKGRCKSVPFDCLDIAVIPGIAMDEKGGRIGTGKGYYDRLIPDLPPTTRKVGLVFENQIISMVPMEAHDKYVDIIITEDRIIYKI